MNVYEITIIFNILIISIVYIMGKHKNTHRRLRAESVGNTDFDIYDMLFEIYEIEKTHTVKNTFDYAQSKLKTLESIVSIYDTKGEIIEKCEKSLTPEQKKNLIKYLNSI